MDSNDWERAVLDVIRRISDESYQEKAWFNLGEEISSPEELYCELFDDLIFEDFLESDDVGITEPQRAAGKMLRDSMDQFSKSFGDSTDYEEIYRDQRWNEIRCLARKFLIGAKHQRGVSE